MTLNENASAQLQPDRLYYGKDRSVPMTVDVPQGKDATVEVHLLEAQTAEVIEKATIKRKEFDPAELFPRLWEVSDEEVELMYAQLVVDEKKIGPAVVLQPLVTPAQANQVSAGGTPRFEKRPPVYSGIRAYVDKNVLMRTTHGIIEISLRPDVAPNTAWNFRHLVEGGFYTDILFHRILGPSKPGNGFVVQAGDPTGQGTGGSGYYIDLEPSTLKHDFGVISMARTSEPNTNGSQFFLCLSREKTKPLDGKYCAFGETVRGADVILKIATVKADPRSGRPLDEQPKIIEAKLVDAKPYGEGKEPVEDPTLAPVER